MVLANLKLHSCTSARCAHCNSSKMKNALQFSKAIRLHVPRHAPAHNTAPRPAKILVEIQLYLHCNQPEVLCRSEGFNRAFHCVCQHVLCRISGVNSQMFTQGTYRRRAILMSLHQKILILGGNFCDQRTQRTHPTRTAVRFIH